MNPNVVHCVHWRQPSGRLAISLRVTFVAVKLHPRSTWRVRVGQTDSAADDGWLIVKNLPCAFPHMISAARIALLHENLHAHVSLCRCRYTADAAAVSAFFQSSPGGGVRVDSFSPVKKGSMNTGDAVLRITKGLPACLAMQVRVAVIDVFKFLLI